MEIEEFKKIMNYHLSKLKLDFENEQINNFYKYMNILIEWNKKINLTAITDPEEIIIKHFIDSLTINKYIREDAKLVDVGTGAGFPGIPLKIYNPKLKIVLVDSLNKRVNFLNEVICKLNLKDIETVHSRIEDFCNDNKYRETFEYSTARAVANLSTLSEYLIPTLKIGGICICMKGNDIKEELKNAERAINILGGRIEDVDEIKLSDTDITRNIIIIKKIMNTPKIYPRKAGLPSKEPIK